MSATEDLRSPVVELTAGMFDEFVSGSSVPVVVDVWAPWCGPCMTFAPVVEQLAVDLGGRLAVGKVNADETPDIAARFAVMSFPTLLVFDGGVLVHRLIGARGRGRLLEELSQWLGE